MVDLREANAKETIKATTTYNSVDFGVIIHITYHRGGSQYRGVLTEHITCIGTVLRELVLGLLAAHSPFAHVQTNYLDIPPFLLPILRYQFVLVPNHIKLGKVGPVRVQPQQHPTNDVAAKREIA